MEIGMPNNIKKDVGRLFVFYYVVTSGSFSKAAKELTMSRAGVMKNIEQLEEKYHTRLINRTTRSFEVNDAGRALYIHAERIFKEAKKACQYLESHQKPEGNVNIQIPYILDREEMYTVLSKLRRNYPGLNLKISLGDAADNLVKNNIDIALQIGELPDSSYFAKSIMKFNTYIVASPLYLSRVGMPSHPRELIEHKCINYSHCVTGNQWSLKDPETKELVFFDLGEGTHADSERLLVSFAEAGEGIATALDIACRDCLKKGSLLSILEDWTYPVNLYAVYATKSNMANKTNLLLKLLEEELPRIFRS